AVSLSSVGFRLKSCGCEPAVVCFQPKLRRLANRKDFRYYIRARYIVDGWSIQGEELNNCEEIMGRSAIEPADLLPLTPAVFHILLALADGERHGYGIMQEVE